ncbi:serine/threonine-protein kinase [Nocardioides sp.]|uniref:serine/threonine-protein kinase n=1 Tax=Nocardioides sp. TaxID=35761 RepID=UPI003D133E33
MHQVRAEPRLPQFTRTPVYAALVTALPRTQPPGPIQVGPYTLLSRIGEGGMGVVHLARRSDGHRVALKVLRPHIVGDDEARERLAREVNSLSLIRSRWVAEIEDSDPWGPIPYVATRYVPGLSLHDHVREDGPVQDLAWFAARLADGLQAVHAVGVLHRDVKPSNVLMEGRAPILIDFGLARVADDPRLTHTGWLLGTPGYLAPEILYGEDATAASDIHSWAATVAFAGTGNPPFGRGPSMAIMDRVRRGEHQLGGLPSGLRDLLDAALSPEPLERPSLREIRTELAGDRPAPTAVRPMPAEEAPLTMPYAAVAAAPAEAPTARTEPDDPTRVFSTEVWSDEPVEPDLFVEEDLDTAGRLRRLALTGSLLILATVSIALAPYLATAVLVTLVWVLRAGSLAGSRHQDRLMRRGRRWYDALVLPFSYPWFLVVALPGLFLLTFWALGLGLAAGLVCFAFSAPTDTTLAIAGASVVTALWWGPGGSRLRGPVRRAVLSASRRPLVWGLMTGGLLAGAAVAALVLGAQGVNWAPATEGPFAGSSFLGGLF